MEQPNEACRWKYFHILCVSWPTSVFALSLGWFGMPLSGFKRVWNDRSISLSSKIQPMRFLVASIFLYASESWTITAELQRRIQAMELRCYRMILRISYKDHVTNEEVRAEIQQAIGPHEDHLTIVKSRKLQWCGHNSRSSGLAKTSSKAQ